MSCWARAHFRHLPARSRTLHPSPPPHSKYRIEVAEFLDAEGPHTLTWFYQARPIAGGVMPAGASRVPLRPHWALPHPPRPRRTAPETPGPRDARWPPQCPAPALPVGAGGEWGWVLGRGCAAGVCRGGAVCPAAPAAVARSTYAACPTHTAAGRAPAQQGAGAVQARGPCGAGAHGRGGRGGRGGVAPGAGAAARAGGRPLRPAAGEPAAAAAAAAVWRR